jgi:hypothetical protein
MIIIHKMITRLGAGLTKLTLNGKGVTGTLKELWRPKAV